MLDENLNKMALTVAITIIVTVMLPVYISLPIGGVLLAWAVYNNMDKPPKNP